jgi:hypothetical protein
MFGGLPIFVLSNLVEVKNVVRGYLAMENWKKVKAR